MMKLHKHIISLLMVSFLAGPSLLAEKKGHDHEHHDHPEMKAPNGGRIIHETSPHAEFFINQEGKVQVTFIDAKGKPVSSDLKVSATGGDRKSPTIFTFEKTKHGFLSAEDFPKGETVPLILVFSDKSGGKKRVRLNIQTANCEECQAPGYACVCECDHDHDHDHGGHGHRH